MYRSSINKLKEWKLDKNKKPLIFLGARQVGKTWLIQEFGKKEYRQVLYINFERADALRNTFLPDLNPKRLITDFELYANLQITPEAVAAFAENRNWKKVRTVQNKILTTYARHSLISDKNRG